MLNQSYFHTMKFNLGDLGLGDFSLGDFGVMPPFCPVEFDLLLHPPQNVTKRGLV